MSSLAANDAFPPPVGRIVELKSAHLGEISGDGNIRYNDQCTPCYKVPNVNHLSIIQIYSEDHPAFCKITEFLGYPC
jgi:hypothetical protein